MKCLSHLSQTHGTWNVQPHSAEPYFEHISSPTKLIDAKNTFPVKTVTLWGGSTLHIQTWPSSVV